ncbi:hypothetical protein ACHAQA_006165 [Verticillium albo-atrum]
MTEAQYTVPFFVGGAEHLAESTFDIVSPASGAIVHKCSAASVADVQAAVAAAAAAFPAWKKLPPARRRDYLLRAADVMDSRKEELVGFLVGETGGTRPWAEFNLITAAELIRDVAGRVATIEGSVVSTASQELSALVLKEPYGVVLAIAPWNAPYILGVRSILFPLAAGNTAILKASELSPRVMWGIVSCFHEAGLPAGVLNMIVHKPQDASTITTALIESPAIKKINFTGSTSVGRIIAKLAAEQLKPVLLELGGKAPAIVWQDADVALAARQCALGAFLNAGQICMSTERIIVHKDIREQFEKELASVVDTMFAAEAVLISEAAVSKTTRLVRDAVEKGALVVAGKGPSFSGEETASGGNKAPALRTRMRPVVLGGITSNMELYNTESFGPTVSLFECETEEHALRLANDTEYGLSSAIFTADLQRALRLSRGIEAGAVHINNMTVHDEAALPHGGAKMSGYGRFNSLAGLDEWVRTKTVTFPV